MNDAVKPMNDAVKPTWPKGLVQEDGNKICWRCNTMIVDTSAQVEDEGNGWGEQPTPGDRGAVVRFYFHNAECRKKYVYDHDRYPDIA